MNGVSRIVVTEDVALVTFPKIAADISLLSDIFSEFAEAQINIDMISQTAPQGNCIDLSFTLPCDQLIPILGLMKQFRESRAGVAPMVSNGNCKIQLYGAEMREMYGVAASVVSAVAKANAEICLITTSEVDISILVSQSHCENAVKALEDAFLLKAE